MYRRPNSQGGNHGSQGYGRLAAVLDDSDLDGNTLVFCLQESRSFSLVGSDRNRPSWDRDHSLDCCL
jgi:hypothetical protein